MTAAIVEQAHGSIEAQAVIDALCDETVSPDHAWLRFVELAACHGWRSVACRAFVLELAKRAAAP